MFYDLRNQSFMLVDANTYSEKEKAKACLFGTAYPCDFVLAFTYGGQNYYKKIK